MPLSNVWAFGDPIRWRLLDHSLVKKKLRVLVDFRFGVEACQALLAECRDWVNRASVQDVGKMSAWYPTLVILVMHRSERKRCSRATFLSADAAG
jgi:hypothetical protein